MWRVADVESSGVMTAPLTLDIPDGEAPSGNFITVTVRTPTGAAVGSGEIREFNSATKVVTIEWYGDALETANGTEYELLSLIHI